MGPYTIKGFTEEVFFFHSIEDLRTWIDGVNHGVYAFAHWEDGRMYVGTTGKTYKSAIEELYEQYKEATGEEYKDD